MGYWAKNAVNFLVHNLAFWASCSSTSGLSPSHPLSIGFVIWWLEASGWTFGLPTLITICSRLSLRLQQGCQGTMPTLYSCTTYTLGRSHPNFLFFVYKTHPNFPNTHNFGLLIRN